MKRGHQPVSKTSAKTGGKSDTTKLAQTISALSKKVYDLPETEDASIKEESKTMPKYNCTNAYITLQKKRD